MSDLVSAARGYLYILSNPSMPGVLKIGASARGGLSRAREMYSGNTGVATPFSLEFEVMVRNPAIRERRLHEHLVQYRINGRREFFNCDLITAVDALLRQARKGYPDRQDSPEALREILLPIVKTEAEIKRQKEVSLRYLREIKAWLGSPAETTHG
jgi:hypothetical protein